MLRIFAVIQDERERFVRAYAKVALAGTILTLPVFAGLIVAAREFILVVFGEQWLPAVVPFQFLCAAGAMRLLTAYASSAIQASGQIWGEVWRKIAQVVLIVSLILAFREWGIQGAAVAVLLATSILAFLMQGLVRQVVGLSWRELIAPLRLSGLAAAGTAAAVAAATVGARHFVPSIQDWILLILQAVAGGVFWAAFMLFARVSVLQDLVDEVLNDIVPPRIRRLIARVRPVSRESGPGAS